MAETWRVLTLEVEEPVQASWDSIKFFEVSLGIAASDRMKVSSLISAPILPDGFWPFLHLLWRYTASGMRCEGILRGRLLLKTVIMFSTQASTPPSSPSIFLFGIGESARRIYLSFVPRVCLAILPRRVSSLKGFLPALLKVAKASLVTWLSRNLLIYRSQSSGLIVAWRCESACMLHQGRWSKLLGRKHLRLSFSAPHPQSREQITLSKHVQGGACNSPLVLIVCHIGPPEVWLVADVATSKLSGICPVLLILPLASVFLEDWVCGP